MIYLPLFIITITQCRLICSFVNLSKQSLYKQNQNLIDKDITTYKPKYLRNQRTILKNAIITPPLTPVIFNSTFYHNIDKQMATIALPAFVSLAADPLASMVDALFIGRLDPSNQAGMGISISAHYSISKLYNDPLLKTSTSLVAGKTDDELSASVSTAMIIAAFIGIFQTAIFMFGGDYILNIMRVPVFSDMRRPAVEYLKWRAAGVPAGTLLLVAIGKAYVVRCNIVFDIICMLRMILYIITAIMYIRHDSICIVCLLYVCNAVIYLIYLYNISLYLTRHLPRSRRH